MLDLGLGLYETKHMRVEKSRKLSSKEIKALSRKEGGVGMKEEGRHNDRDCLLSLNEWGGRQL